MNVMKEKENTLLLFECTIEHIKYKVYVNSEYKPCLGELSSEEAGQNGLWCFCPEVCFILPEELIEIVDKLKELNAGRAINN